MRSVMLHRCVRDGRRSLIIFCPHDVTAGQRGETHWPAPWGALYAGRIPKDTQWWPPAPTWWGAHSVCRRSSPSTTLRPKPRPSWVSCPASYLQPINGPNTEPKIQVWWWKHEQKNTLQDRMGRLLKYPLLRDVLKHLRAQHPSRPLATAICTKLRRSTHFPGIPSHPAPPIISHPVRADPPPGGGGGTAGNYVPGG